MKGSRIEDIDIRGRTEGNVRMEIYFLQLAVEAALDATKDENRIEKPFLVNLARGLLEISQDTHAIQRVVHRKEVLFR